MAGRSRARDGLRNEAQFLLTTRGEPVWNATQSNPWLRRRLNRALINSSANVLEPRPDPLSTMAPYTSWASLTDRAFDARHIGPAAVRDGDLPPVEEVAELFRRPEGKILLCPKSTVMLPYFAQWFTDGFLRSERPGPDGSRPDPRRNESTHDVDLCQIYGVTARATEELRAHEDGLLQSQQINGETYPPYLYENGTKRFPSITVAREEEVPPERRGELFAIGTDTGNAQIGHVMLNVLFLREHNRIATELSREYPAWGDERLFQTARMILIVLLLKVVIEEYIRHNVPVIFKLFLEGASAFQRQPWMRSNRMSSEFNLLYRWHSLIPSTLQAGGRERAIGDTTFNPALVVEHGLGRLFEEASSQRAGRIALFNTAPELVPVEAAGIRKGREVALAPYNDYRELVRRPRVTDFDQISHRREVQEGLAACYGSVDRIEFFAGLFAEDTWPNSICPPLIGTLVGTDAFSQVFTNPLLAPRIYTPDTFSPSGWRAIQTTRTLGDILRRNVPPRERPYTVTFTRPGWRRR
jgi:prostaglandin-endoperoxide synthase 2